MNPIELTPNAEPLPPIKLDPGPLHFSTLSRMARSPAHVRHAMVASTDRETTRDMRIGVIVHHIVCGAHKRRPLVRYPGEERRGGDWKLFERSTKAANALTEIVTEREWAHAEPIACAVLADPVAAPLILGSRREVALEWEDAGIKCATDGIDGVNDAKRAIWDLKFTGTSAEPASFSRHGSRMGYHAQMAWMENAAHQNGIPTDGGVYLIAVEDVEPHVVTVLRCGPDVLAAGRKTYVKWMERYRQCLENDSWPGYAQGIADFELPAWLDEGEGEE
jgi:hypothetical protein